MDEGKECPYHDVTSCGPLRRGYIVITHVGFQLVICSESEMKSDVIKRVALGENILQLEDDINELPEDIKKVAAVELRETPELIEQSLKKFRELLISELKTNFEYFLIDR